MKKNKNKIIIVITIIFTILCCTLPMGLSPMWNGKKPEHRNQYELLADSILNGHLFIDYKDIDKKLLRMENPYDPDARNCLDVKVHWDHAFYGGKYYVYFGIAPVFLTFIPYKIITGHTLTTYHSTQIFVAFYIIGVFALFYFIYKTFFKKLKLLHYLLLSMALSVLSIWSSIGRPALYSTAIVSGLCMAIWSLYFYMKAVYGNNNLNKSVVLATIGALFGATTFACRPPIGLFNILTIPLLIEFFKKYGFNKKNFFKIMIAIIPYIVVASLLMVYNYVRFDNVFEFGQSYQLTSADQHKYLNILSRINILTLVKELFLNFFLIGDYTKVFPFVGISGVFINFPILIIPYILIFNKKFVKKIKEKDLFLLYVFLMIVPLLVTILDIMSAPNLGERYRLDEYYLLSILTFIAIANYYSIHTKNRILNWLIILILGLTIFKCILLFMVPLDYNITDYYKSINPKINNIIFFWK